MIRQRSPMSPRRSAVEERPTRRVRWEDEIEEAETLPERYVFFMINEQRGEFVMLGEMIDGSFQLLENDGIYYEMKPFEILLDQIREDVWDIDETIELERSDRLSAIDHNMVEVSSIDGRTLTEILEEYLERANNQ